MSQLSLLYKIIGDNKDIIIIETKGFLDGNTCSELKVALKKILNKDIIKIIVDCKELAYISSAGLGVFMFALNELEPKGGKLILINMNEDIYSVFSMLGFNHIYTILDSFEDAMNYFESN